MSEYLHFADFKRELAPTPLLPDGHQFTDTDVVYVTEWGDVLPPVDFSRSEFEKLTSLARTDQPTLFDEHAVLILARYLEPKLTFDESKGCWLLPLKAEYDEKGRARYPQVTVASLGYSKQLAHRASLETFFGIPLPRGEGRQNAVDHRCRAHACCNPYHLDVVTIAVNNQRMALAGRRNTQPELFQVPNDQAMTFGELILLMTRTATSDAAI